MTIENQQAIVRLLRSAGRNVKAIDAYSGRGMFGERTAAIEVQTERSLSIAVRFANSAGFAIQHDSLGKGFVAY